MRGRDLPRPRRGRAALPRGRRARAAAPWLDKLNPEQREAVEATEGPVLVLAGAGTGKTRVLTTRIAHLLATGRAKPWQILAVTFTNKAAREMKDRVGDLIGGVVEGMQWLGTFHSIGARMLRRHAELVGLKSDFTILDTDDQIRLMKQIIEAEDIDEKRWPARQLAGHHRPLEEPRADARRRARGRTGAPSPTGAARKLYAAYQERLKMLNAADFGDLLLRAADAVLRSNAGRARRLPAAASATSWSTSTRTPTSRSICGCGCWRQARQRSNICCVGDDDQSIYGWRGAEVDNILRFEKDFPGAKVIRLERNYRSTAAYPRRRLGPDRPQRGPARQDAVHRRRRPGGDARRRRLVWDGEEEARAIGEEIEQLQRAGRGAERDRDPGARLLPDARLRGPLHHARPPLSRHRRPALLRAPGDPRRARLFPRDRAAAPTTSPSSASSTRRAAASARRR